MRNLLLPVLLCVLLPFQKLDAQYYFLNDKYYDNPVVFELGLTGGVMNCFTDLGGKKGIGRNFIKDLRWKYAKPAYGIYFNAMYRNAIALRLEGTFGEVSAYDSILKAVASSTYGRYERNLSFKSRISEIQLGAEIHPLHFRNYDEKEPPPYSPYIVLSVGYFSFDPQAFMNGQWYPLQPLRTEGQGFAEYPDRKPYKLSQVNFGLGMGLKYEINTTFNVRLEFLHRILQTDYLDDVSTTYINPDLFYNYLPLNRAAVAEQISFRRDELNPSDIYPVDGQRGDPADNDSYFTILLKFGFIFGRQLR
jgi:hypothetical protein